MKTLLKIIILFCGFCIHNINGQITFDNIDSNNALYIISNTPVINSDLAIKNSFTEIIQFGDKNYAAIDTNSRTQISAQQIGDYNFLNFDNSFEKSAAKPNITVEGNNNIIDVVGSNSISEKIQIHVKGDNRTIFMRNF